MLKKILILFFLLCSMPAFSLDDSPESYYQNGMEIQKRINSIGFEILNANKIDNHITFLYDPKDKLIKGVSTLTKRQIAFYDKYIFSLENDDEIAAMLAEQISNADRTFQDGLGSFASMVQIKLAPKKFEILADKRAVDYMVKAGYNPIGLITFINKTYPQAKQEFVSGHNLTSKRLMYIYEKIAISYPQYLVNNEYQDNPYYQNFLLNSIENRQKLKEKIRTHSIKVIKYD